MSVLGSLASLLAVALSLFTRVADAVVLQPTPGGAMVPFLANGPVECARGNVELCINDHEGGPLIDAQEDALVAPETFLPTCQLIFTPITKFAGDQSAFGWYNVKEDPANPGKFLKPTQEELYGMFILNFGDVENAALEAMAPPVVLNLAAEAAAGRYKGGSIAFWLAADGNLNDVTLDPTTHQLTGRTLTRIFYTQHALNPGSAAASTFYQVLTWQSVAFQQSFYFGWEDIAAHAGSDNDFEDLVFFVSGIQCAGGGEPCDTGKLGVCQRGTNQCQKGILTCVQSVQPSSEMCNALDDDCNGQVDDGDGLCEVGKICDRGHCVPKCGTGEFRCAPDLVCTAKGVCVEAACATKECPPGQLCQAGNCIDSCAGVTCPHGTECRSGACVDLCLGIQCDPGATCLLGVCQTCECSACGDAQVCHQNVCVDSGCETQTCGVGSYCSKGTCLDKCGGVVCPVGQVCSAGACVSDGTLPPMGGSTTGMDPGIDVPIVLMPNGSGGAGQGGPQGTGNAGAATRGSGETAGCLCSTVPRRSSVGPLIALALAAASGLRRRQSRQRLRGAN